MARAPSVWFHYDDSFPGDIIHQSILVPKDGDTLYSYYCCMQWNAGHDGGGYCGIQNSPDGRLVIYSIWNPTDSTEVVKEVLAGPSTKVSTFGGEGVGMKSLNSSIGWATDQWYSMVSRVWDHSGHTYFGFWFKDETANQWHHIITADYPKPGIKFRTSTSSFLEDWLGSGKNNRNLRFRNGFKQKTDGTWFPFKTGRFNVVQEAATMQYNKNYDAGSKGDYFYLSTGGSVTPTEGLGTSKTFTVTNSDSPPHQPVDFSISEATCDQVSWTVPASSTPQFKYTVKLQGKAVASETRTEVRSQTLQNANVGDTVEVTVEDVLGNVSTNSEKIA